MSISKYKFCFFYKSITFAKKYLFFYIFLCRKNEILFIWTLFILKYYIKVFFFFLFIIYFIYYISDFLYFPQSFMISFFFFQKKNCGESYLYISMILYDFHIWPTDILILVSSFWNFSLFYSFKMTYSNISDNNRRISTI